MRVTTLNACWPVPPATTHAAPALIGFIPSPGSTRSHLSNHVIAQNQRRFETIRGMIAHKQLQPRSGMRIASCFCRPWATCRSSVCPPVRLSTMCAYNNSTHTIPSFRSTFTVGEHEEGRVLRQCDSSELAPKQMCLSCFTTRDLYLITARWREHTTQDTTQPPPPNHPPSAIHPSIHPSSLSLQRWEVDDQDCLGGRVSEQGLLSSCERG
jgi:hypothetical protein